MSAPTRIRPTRTAPRRNRTLRLFGGGVSLRWEVRAALTVVGLLLVLVLLGVAALLTGAVAIPPSEVLAGLLGHGSRSTDYAVLGLRLPRLATGIVVGAALGISGAIFQTVSRNPLGSPDIIGFTTGAASGAIVAILVWGSGGGSSVTSSAAVIGGLVTAVIVYGLAYRRGVDGFRLILTGIGVGALLASLNAYLITRAQLRNAQEAQAWLVGSLNGRTWEDAFWVMMALLVTVPIALGLGRRLAMLEMGPEAARARGVPVDGTSLVLVAVAVVMTAVATAATGPVAFVALAAPQLARRLSRTEGAGLVTAALMGAALLTASDIVAQRLVPSRPLPVGIGTAAVGGVYLAWLLAREWRRGRT
ncbi:FecCD family ABC transporter permease [Pseudonocardia sp. GCM10023141]|uniref:FecCD family ABC transporter permease n=1 Tax=Pseudonocardia sp. GCM10023141 TaxID=3252653 RepID=UPI003617C3A7